MGKMCYEVGKICYEIDIMCYGLKGILEILFNKSG